MTTQTIETQSAAPLPESANTDLWKWAAAYGALWILLSALHDTPSTSDFASVLAWAITVSAAIVLIPKVRTQIGV